MASAGLITLTVWGLCRQSVATSMYQPGLVAWLQRLGYTFVVLGCIGTIAAWRRWTCILLSYGFLSFVLSISCFLLSTMFLVTAYGDVSAFSDACGFALFTGNATVSEPANTYQTAYNSMRNALDFCRQYKPAALRLDGCQDALDKVAPGTRDFAALFRQLEASYSCSGVCFDDVSLYALPSGNVTWDNRLQHRPACASVMMSEVRLYSYIACFWMWLLYLGLIFPACTGCWLACAPPPRRIPGWVHNPEELEWLSTQQHLLEDPNSDENDEVSCEGDDLELSESRSLLCG